MTTPATAAADHRRALAASVECLLTRARDIADRDDITLREALDLEELAELTSEIRHVWTILAGVENFKVRRNGTASLSLETSIDYAHKLADAAILSGRGRLVCDLYVIDRADLFGDDGGDSPDPGADPDPAP